jgi:hypothetical protein
MKGSQNNKAPGHHQGTPKHQEPERAAFNAVKIEPRADENDKDAAAQKYQKRQLRIARWLNWITAAGTVVALSGLVFIYLTLRATEESVKLSAEQFRLVQASDLGVVNISIVDHVTSRFTIANFGNLAARNIVVRVKEDYFPTIHAMTFFRYDPLTELDKFRSGEPSNNHREALTKEESAETVSAIGPFWHSVGHLRHNDQWSYDYTVPFTQAAPPEQSVISLLVTIDWDDALEHRRGSACQLFINAKAVGCQQFVLGLPAPKSEDQ